MGDLLLCPGKVYPAFTFGRWVSLLLFFGGNESAVMDRLCSDLVEIEACLREALLNLREQQAVSCYLDDVDEIRKALLSASLRSFAWMEDHRNTLAAAICEYLPLKI